MNKLSFIFCFTLLLLVGCISQPNHITQERDFDQLKAAKTRISLGLTYLKNGNFSQAKYNLDKALQFAPRSADAHFALAYYYQQVEEQEAAEKAYQTAMDLEPNNANIANSYGAFLCQRGDYAEAKRYFLKAVNSDNYISSSETYENLALCSQTHGQVEDALQYLRSAVNHQPGRAKSLYLLVQLLAESNQWLEAKDVLRRYEKVSQVSPNSLLLASKIESALGNTQLADGYGKMLLRMYPSDPATAIYLQQRRTASPDTSTVASKSNRTLFVESRKTVHTTANTTAQAPVEKVLTPQTTNTIAAKKPEDANIPVTVIVNEPKEEIPVAVIVSEPEADIPVTVIVNEPKEEIPVAEIVSEPEADIPVAVIVSESEADIPVAVIVSEPEADIPDAVQEDTALIDSPVETTANEILKDVATKKLALEEDATDTIESSASNGLITDIAENSKEIEQAEIVVVEDSEPLTKQAPTFHIVQKEENLYRISLLYNIKLQRLIEWNNLPDSSSIYIGKKLIIVAPENQE